MPSPLAVPTSPSSSSKRSRSRDSNHSAATTSFATNANSPNVSIPNLALHNASSSAPSLIIPSPVSQTPEIIEPEAEDPTPYPAFLKAKRSEIQSKFIDLEWEQRRRLAAGTQYDSPSKWARVSPETSLNRNRYANVDPYQQNRIKLQVPEGHNDYINASPIKLVTTCSETELSYIATQGPKAEITSHIWRMIWHETASPAVIVMLTQTFENGREKCHTYYPKDLSSPTMELNAHDEFEDGLKSTVTLQSITECEDSHAIIRELELHAGDGDGDGDGDSGGETKKVWHLLFAGWPDFLVPEGADRAALINLINLSREKNTPTASTSETPPDTSSVHSETTPDDGTHNPRIIHCSAGVGRSGTFIALDFLLQELREGSLDEVEEDLDPIVEVVDKLRRQRMMMVQGEAQFLFLYDVLREKWRERWVGSHEEEAERLGLLGEKRGGVGIGDGTASRSSSMPRKKLRSERVVEGESEGDEDENAEVEAEMVEEGMTEG